MTAPALSPRSHRMIFWMAIAPAVLLLLAFVGANWKVFHLAWCKRMMSSAEPSRQLDGLYALARTHFRPGMTLKEITRLAGPLKVDPPEPPDKPRYYIRVDASTPTMISYSEIQLVIEDGVYTKYWPAGGGGKRLIPLAK